MRRRPTSTTLAENLIKSAEKVDFNSMSIEDLKIGLSALVCATEETELSEDFILRLNKCIDRAKKAIGSCN